MLVAAWIIIFTQTWAGVPYTIAAEIPNEQLRDKSFAFAIACGYIINLIVVISSPFIQNTEYRNIGGKVTYICACPRR